MPAEQRRPRDPSITGERFDERQAVEALFKKGIALLAVTDEASQVAEVPFFLEPSANYAEASQLILSYNPPSDGIPQRLSVIHASLTYLPLPDLAQVPIDIFFHADVFYPGGGYQTVGRDSSEVLSLPETIARTEALLQRVASFANRRGF